MVYVQISRGCLLPGASVYGSQVHGALGITCLTFWFFHSPSGLAFSGLLQIKYCPFRCCQITRQTKQGSDWTHKQKHNFYLLLFNLLYHAPDEN